MLKAHRTLLHQVVYFAALVVVTLWLVFNPPVNVLTVGLVGVTVGPAAVLVGDRLRRFEMEMRGRSSAELNALEQQIVALRSYNDDLEEKTLRLQGAVTDARLQLRTPTYDYIGEGVRAKKKRLRQERLQLVEPLSDDEEFELLRGGPLSRGSREAARAGEARTRIQAEDYADGAAGLDPDFEWEETFELGSADPIYVQSRCRHPSERVEPVYLGDDPAGPLVARLCTKCGSQLPGEGEYA